MKSSFIVIAILVLFSTAVICQNKKGHHHNDGVITSYMDLKKHLISSSKFLAFVVIAGKECKNCEKAYFIFEQYKQQMEGYVNSYFLDCEQMWKNVFEREHFSICDPSNSGAWPYVQFFKPPEEEFDPNDPDSPKKRTPEPIQFKDALSESNLIEFTKPIMPLFASQISSKEEIEQQLENKTILHKVMLFLRPNQETPHYFKALTSHYRYKIKFCVVTADDDLLNVYNIDDTPTIITFRYNRSTQQYKQEEYSGPKRINSAKTFFQKYSSGIEKREGTTTFKPKNDSINYNVTIIHEFNKVSGQFNPNSGMLFYLSTANNDLTNLNLESLETNPKYSAFLKHFIVFIDNVVVFPYQKYDFSDELLEFFYLNNLSDDEEHLLFYPTGNKQLNNFFKIKPKQSKQQMIKEVFELTEYKEDVLDEEAMQHFVQNALRKGKIATALFVDSKHEQTEEILLFIRFLSSQKKFQDCASFGIYKDASEYIQKAWKIEKIPYLLSFLNTVDDKESIQTAIFDSASNFSYLAIHNYLSSMCFSKEKEQIESEIIIETNTQDDFDRLCGNGQVCFIAFLDYSRENKYNIDLDIYKTIAENFRHQSKINWVYIDGRCHKQLLKRINLNEQDLPYFMYYNSSKWTYKVMEESFVFKELKEFVQRMVAHKGRGAKRPKVNKLSDAFDIDERDCSKLRERKYDL